MTLFDAWIDESGSNQQSDPGTYVLSAAICDRVHAEAVREVMRALLIGRRHRKLHWRDEDRRRQFAIASAIARTEVEHLVVVRSHPTGTDHPERQRRLCMERLLPELVVIGFARGFRSRLIANRGVDVAAGCVLV